MRKAKEHEAAHVVIDGERCVLEDGDDYRELRRKDVLKGLDIIAPIGVLEQIRLRKPKASQKQGDAADRLFDVTDKYKRKR